MDSAESAACMPLCTCTSEEVGGSLLIHPWTPASGLHSKQLVPRKGSAEEDNSEQSWPGQLCVLAALIWHKCSILDLTGSSL